jgi:hypothetical protein
MKQRRRPTRRKPFRQPKKLLPQASARPSGDIAALTGQVSNAVLDPIGTPDGSLALRLHAGAKVGVQVETTVIRAAPYQEMLSRIEVLERLITELPNQRPNVGHNIQPITGEDVQEIRQAVAILKAQPVVPDKAKAAGSTLKKIGERLGTYLDAFLLEAAKSAGKEFGKRLVQVSYWLALATTLMSVAQSVAAWLP